MGLVEKRFVITVDGPAGAGKSTVSRRLAEKLSYRYLDTGALYRAVAYQADQEGLSSEREEDIAGLCERIRIDLEVKNGEIEIYVNRHHVTGAIRAPKISMLASRISALPTVRRSLLSLQRNLARQGGVVAEGRDMGTVVFPEADVKFYLDATIEERAKRRYAELLAKGYDSDLEGVQREIIERDEQDREREVAPLRPAKDAVVIDSTTDNVERVVARMLEVIKKSGG